MATSLKSTTPTLQLSAEVKGKKIGIVVAEWNKDITGKLLEGAESALRQAGVESVNTKWVPGSFELPLGAQYLMEHAGADAVICIGCLIKGETPHFHYISDSVTNTLSRLNIQYTRPVVYGVLTVDTLEQAQERAGGKLGNKGEEAAHVALQMLQLREDIRADSGKKKLGF